MPTYLLIYRAGSSRAREAVEADELRRESSWLVLRRTQLVVGMPRLVVALRVPVREVVSVRVR
ncbi:MAG: hypothetical protein M3Q27_10035 [Actinomycetota bacterium]|nr:hypothetical protein [Actinomycetota bacterium]